MATIGLPLVCSASRSQLCSNGGKQKKSVPTVGNFKHLFGAVKNDWEFLKNGVSKSVEWANETLHVSEIVKKVDDAVWLRNFEDPNSLFLQTPSLPQPSYPALSGMDLLSADLKALAAYGNYFYCMSKIWSRPLPEFYDAQDIADYFNCRPHVVALRLLERFQFVLKRAELDWWEKACLSLWRGNASDRWVHTQRGNGYVITYSLLRMWVVLLLLFVY